MSPKLTEHFSEKELDVDGESHRIKGLAVILCYELLEPIRAHFDKPMRVTSGYRNEVHNRAVGGKPTSFHRFEDGRCAADFDIPGVPIDEVFDWLRLESGLKFDKIILESKHNISDVIHIQLDVNSAPRRLAYIGSTGDGKLYILQEVRNA